MRVKLSVAPGPDRQRIYKFLVNGSAVRGVRCDIFGTATSCTSTGAPLKRPGRSDLRAARRSERLAGASDRDYGRLDRVFALEPADQLRGGRPFGASASSLRAFQPRRSVDLKTRSHPTTLSLRLTNA